MIFIHVVSCLETQWDNLYNILFINIIYVYGGGEIYFPLPIMKIKSMIVVCRSLRDPTLVAIEREVYTFYKSPDTTHFC